MYEIKKYETGDSKLWDNFVENDSINGTIYHSRIFLSYHKDRFIDHSIMIYHKKNLIAVFPCCKYNNEYYSHRGSTQGGIIIKEKYYTLSKLTEIMDEIYNYYNENLYIKLSESVYFKNNTNNNLLNFVLSQKCSCNKDISLYFDLNKNEKIIDSFPKNDNKRLLLKYIKKNDKEISFQISNEKDDYIKYYELLKKMLKVKNNVSPLHSLEEFILLKELLDKKQFLFLSKNKNGDILSGALVFIINNNTYYTVYLMTNYEKKHSACFYLLYELFKLAKKNKINIVNLGACSTGGGKNILYSKYKFKKSCGCLPDVKFNFSYIKKISINTNNLNIRNMEFDEQHIISYLWKNNNYASKMFFFKNNEFNYNNQIKWYNKIKNDNNSNYLSIFEKQTRNFIGYCGIKNISINNCEIFIVILNNNYYNKGFGKECFKWLISYTKNKYPNKKIYLNVKKNNTIAIKMYKKNNFKVENEFNDILKMVL